MLFRAAACTGALYHIDVYVVAGPLADLDAGVYHFAPERFALTLLRPGDHRGALVEAAGGEPAVAHAPAILVFASTFWRNSWKYRDRAYRHCYWDGGTMLANGLAAATARDIPARVVMGFADASVNHLLGLDAGKEAALCLVPAGREGSPAAPSGEALPPLDYATRPLSRREVDYPSIREMHAASSLETGAEARSWREGEDPNVTPAPGSSPGQGFDPGSRRRRGPALAGRRNGRDRRCRDGRCRVCADRGGENCSDIRGGYRRNRRTRIALDVTPAASLPAAGIEQVIVRRGSTRRFSHDSITFAQLSNALHYATRGVATDVDPGGRAAHQPALPHRQQRGRRCARRLRAGP